MKIILTPEEYNCFVSGADDPYFRGIRVNTLKCSVNKARELLPFLIKKTPFCEEGFYIPHDIQGLGLLPLHCAGAFYAQEPSAMSAVTILDVQPGDRVLDLCAAPGGKSAQIAAALGGEGLLWSNEVVKSRANILLSNIERMGISNAVVSSCRPEKLCPQLEGFFDRVLVDAPCSGEGMFRRDETVAAEWTPEHSLSCAERQLAILDSAAQTLREGGTLVYSTCTFSAEENEGVISRFLEGHREFELVDCGADFGRRAMEKAVRILPEDGGEGHFAAKLIKKGEGFSCISNGRTSQNFDEKKAALKLYDEIFIDRPFGEKFDVIGDKLLLLPDTELPLLKGMGVLRAGLLFGEIKKNRIEPCHALFTASKREQLRSFIDLSENDDRLSRFLHGEEIAIDDELKGFTALLVEGISLGFGKAVGGTLKNRYPKGLRLN